MKKIIVLLVLLFLLVGNCYAKTPEWERFKGRAISHFQARSYAKAIENFSKAIELAPDSGLYLYGLYLFRGQAYSFEKLYDQAISDFITCIEINPDDVAAYCERGKTYALKGWLDQAFYDLNRAIRMKPDDGLSYLYRANVYYNAKEYKRAWEDLKKAQLFGQTVSVEMMETFENKALGRVKKEESPFFDPLI
ncbi:MAG: tetratricopeptide repeat protein [Candidatus Omnitrophota bacterium]